MIAGKAVGKAALLSEGVRAEIDAWTRKFPEDRRQSAVIAALTAVQHEQRWVSTEMMDAVADYLRMPPIAVYEVASFYSMFELNPVGRHVVAVCNNISCALRGGDDLIDHIGRKYGVKPGETTADGRFTLKKEEECLAACCGAPMMTVDGHYHEHLTAEQVDAILDALE
ncbi:MAG: NAD(P)H-dependent oxidoreductase subunit E [Gammaproteobacteria bacterium]|jgi:NADH-quinone oxidoreductase subunit E|nr:NAD(P)H-dependent oxidoreductase subunit E [Gammaproteobacteria bacterium]